MNNDAIKFSRNDPYIVVLHRELIQARIHYEGLREEPQNFDRIRDHKFSVKHLIEEIHETCRNCPHWQTGKQQLETLVDIRHDLESYYDEVFNHDSIEVQGRRFLLYHHEFYSLVRHLLKLII